MTKEFLAFVLLSAGITGGTLLALAWPRARDAFFLAMVFLAPLTELYDVNFVSRDWYRGTVRGFEISLVDILSVSLLAGLMLLPKRGNSRFFWVPSLGFVLLFFAYSAFTVVIADPRLWGLFELSKMARGLLVFLAVAFYVRGEREVRLFLWGWAAIVCYQGLLAIEQRYRFGIHRVFGTLIEANSLSVFFCTTAPVLVAAISSSLPRLLKLACGAGIGLAAIGEVLTISRAGTVAFALALCGAALATMTFRITARKVAVGMVVLAGTAAIAAKSWETLAARFSESTLDEEYADKSKLGRGYYIRIAMVIAANQPFGVGLNNWSYWVSNKWGPRLGYRFVPYKGTDVLPSDVVPPDSNVDMAQAAPAHNLAALTLGEMGYPGLILLLLMWLRWFQMGLGFLWPRVADPMRRIPVGLLFGLSGMFLQSLTEWVFRQSPLYYVANILLAVLASLYFIKRRERHPGRDAEALPAPQRAEATDPVDLWGPNPQPVS